MNARISQVPSPISTGQIITRLTGWLLAWMIVGTVALSGPWVIAPGRNLNWSWIDAWFTATSAVTLTGLRLSDIGGQFSAWGLAILALLMQMGSLGVIVAGCTLARSWGWSIAWMNHPHAMRRIVGTVLGIELIGAVLLLVMMGDQSAGFLHRVGWSLFHAISAFSQGGLSLGLTGHDYPWAIHLVLVPMMVMGGLGLPVLMECASRLWRGWSNPSEGKREDLSLHSRWTLTTWAGLYVLGALLLTIAQLKPALDASLHGLTENREQTLALSTAYLGHTIADASFLSVSARTAGMPLSSMPELQPAGKWTVVGLMLLGGSPGSSAGGIHTITLAILLVGAIAAWRGRTALTAFGVTLPDRLLRQAILMLVAFILLTGLATFLLTLSEADNFIALLMEAFSAATNNGLSSRSSTLTAMGQVVITMTMLLGRLTSLACLGSLAWITVSAGPDKSLES